MKDRLPSFQTPPSRRNGMPSANYTWFVKTARIAFPLIGLVLIGVVISRLARETPLLSDLPQTKKTAAGQIELVDAKYEGADDAGHAYTLTAKAAVHSPQTPDVVLLDSPKGDIMTDDGAWLAVTARNGSYDTKTSHLTLEKEVVLYHDAGYEAHFEALDIDVKTKQAHSALPVAAQGPLGELRAQNMTTEGGGRIVFGGPVTLTLHSLGGRGKG